MARSSPPTCQHCCTARVNGDHRRLSDTALVKLFRLLRLARRLLDLEAGAAAAWNVSEGGQHVHTTSAQPGRHCPGARMTFATANCAAARPMGFGEAELDALKHPALISVLANASVSWCSVTVNREVLQRLLRQAQDVEKEIATVDRMLRLGASTEMVSRFYGLTHQEVALRREILGLPKRKGRHPVLDENQDTEAVAAMEGRDQQQERRSRRRDLHPRCGHGLGRRHVAASVGGLGLDQELGRSGIGLSHGRGRHRTTARQGPIALADLFDAALKDLTPNPNPRAPAPTPTAQCPRLRRPATPSYSVAIGTRRVPRRLFARPPPDTAGAQRLAGVPADAQRRRRDDVPDL